LYLETITALLERGALVKQATALVTQEEEGPRRWFTPMFEHGVPWHKACLFDEFEKVAELVARQQGKKQFPTDWAVDLMYLAIKFGGPVSDFCDWYVPGVYFLAPFYGRMLTMMQADAALRCCSCRGPES
jgi:hypothetical protein